MTGRTKRGRFAQGNTIARSGWHGLVAKRFGGDYGTAREYVRQLGRYSYAKQTLQGTCLEFKMSLYPHPGTPEQYIAKIEASGRIIDAEPLAF